MKPIISIVIPTYNGSLTISKTIQTVVDQIKAHKLTKKVELVVTDDSSSDDTWLQVTALSAKYTFIKSFRNSTNLGMDRNFIQAAKHARGEYIWFCGQDDLFLDQAILTVLNILIKQDLCSLYVDFEQYSAKDKAIICQSMVKKQYKLGSILRHLLIFNSANEYFREMSDAPSFLPATIIKKSVFFQTNLSPYFNTYYIQYAAFILTMGRGQTGVYTRPLVKGLIPANGWQHHGNSLFSVALGKLYAQYLLHNNNSQIFTSIIFNSKKREFIFRWPKLIVLSSYFGLTMQPEFRDRLYKIFPLVIARFFVFNIMVSSAINSIRLRNNDKTN